MIGFQETIPIFIVALVAWFLGPKIWNGLRKGALKAVKDTKEFGSELSSIVKEDIKPKEDNIVIKDTKPKDSKRKG